MEEQAGWSSCLVDEQEKRVEFIVEKMEIIKHPVRGVDDATKRLRTAREEDVIGVLGELKMALKENTSPFYARWRSCGDAFKQVTTEAR